MSESHELDFAWPYIGLLTARLRVFHIGNLGIYPKSASKPVMYDEPDLSKNGKTN